MKIQMFKKSVCQKAWCSDPKWVFEQLRDFWSSFWSHSRPVDPAQTQYLVDALPELPPFDPQITRDDVATAIQQLQLGKARGLDGFSNFELHCLHDQDMCLLAAVFNSIMATGQWPDELCDGVVALTAKVEQPQVPKDGRPITILSTIFRLFGKIFSRKILHHYLPHLPKSLFGSIPGRSSCDAAWQLATQIEEAMATDTTLFGVSLDLSKAYSLLPRQLLMQMAVKTGWPPALTRVYENFLSKLRRYFRLADGLWGPVTSTVGVPEGCPLAVSCMVLVTWAMTARVANLGIPLISYVDNWSAQTPERHSVSLFLQEVAAATRAMQLILNADKTRVYATSAVGRVALRKTQFQGSPLQVCLKLDDLGVDFNSTKTPAAAALLRRVEAVQPRLMRLQRTPWSHTRKAQVLVRSIHSAVSFGVEFASTAASTCSLIRGKYSAAIWGAKNHRNHFLSPVAGLDIIYEPFLLFLLRRISSLRRAFSLQPEHTQFLWNLFVSTDATTTGPFAYLFSQMRSLGWAPLRNLRCCNHAGSELDLCLLSQQQLKDAMHESWWKFITSKLPDQPGYAKADHTSLLFTLSLRRVTKCSVPIVGSFTVGAALSSGHKRHFLDQQDAVCKFCGSNDDYSHRLRFCPQFAAARSQVPQALLETLDDETLLRGLWSEPPEGVAAKLLFDAIPPPRRFLNLLLSMFACLRMVPRILTPSSRSAHGQ